MKYFKIEGEKEDEVIFYEIEREDEKS